MSNEKGVPLFSVLYFPSVQQIESCKKNEKRRNRTKSSEMNSQVNSTSTQQLSTPSHNDQHQKVENDEITQKQLKVTPQMKNKKRNSVENSSKDENKSKFSVLKLSYFAKYDKKKEEMSNWPIFMNNFLNPTLQTNDEICDVDYSNQFSQQSVNNCSNLYHNNINDNSNNMNKNNINMGANLCNESNRATSQRIYEQTQIYNQNINHNINQNNNQNINQNIKNKQYYNNNNCDNNSDNNYRVLINNPNENKLKINYQNNIQINNNFIKSNNLSPSTPLHSSDHFKIIENKIIESNIDNITPINYNKGIVSYVNENIYLHNFEKNEIIERKNLNNDSITQRYENNQYRYIDNKIIDKNYNNINANGKRILYEDEELVNNNNNYCPTKKMKLSFLLN